jgi:hypothetical protein
LRRLIVQTPEPFWGFGFFLCIKVGGQHFTATAARVSWTTGHVDNLCITHSSGEPLGIFDRAVKEVAQKK